MTPFMDTVIDTVYDHILNERVIMGLCWNQKKPGELAGCSRVHARYVDRASGVVVGTRGNGVVGTVRTVVVPRGHPPGPNFTTFLRFSSDFHEIWRLFSVFQQWCH